MSAVMLHVRSSYLWVVVIVCVSACDSNVSVRNIENCNPTNIRLDITEKLESYPVSRFLDSIQYIELKTPKNLVIGEINKIVFLDSLFFISDFDNSIFCFHESGHFKYQLKRPGKGPGEYIKLTDFTIDTENDQIIISDDQKLIYNDLADGAFIRQHKSISASYKMEYIGDNHIFYDAAYNTDPHLSDGDELCSFFISDGQKVVARYFAYDDEIRSAVGFYNKMPQFYKYKGNILFSPLLINDVYVFETGQVHCKYHIDYGSLNVPDKLLNAHDLAAFLAKKSEYALLCETIETDAFVILYSELQSSPIVSVYNKKTAETANFDYKDMRNDIDGMPLNPFTATDPVGNLISVVYPASVIDSGEEFEFVTVKEYAGKLHEFDNPIIAICYAKR